MKACKDCNMIVKTGKVCPNCGSSKLSTRYSGVAMVLDTEHSKISKTLGVEKKGEYALRVK